jgi:hypothetical protein
MREPEGVFCAAYNIFGASLRAVIDVLSWFRFSHCPPLHFSDRSRTCPSIFDQGCSDSVRSRHLYFKSGET